MAGNRIPNFFSRVNWAVKNVGHWRASILFLQGNYFSIRLDIFKCRNYKTKSRISARKMWRGLISGCVQSCGWPQRIPGKQQNLQNWVCCNLLSREQIQILVGQMLQIPPAEQSQGSCWKPYPDFIQEEWRGTWPSGALPIRQVHFLSQNHERVEHFSSCESSWFNYTSNNATHIKEGPIPLNALLPMLHSNCNTGAG